MSENDISPSVPLSCEPDAEGRCGLCGDEAATARVIALDLDAGIARVEMGASIRTVALDLVEGVAVGDAVLVHQGFAIGRLEGA